MATRPVPSRHGRQRRPRWRCRRCGATSPWTWLGCGNGNGSLPGYDDQIKPLVESAAPDIAAWMQPETKDVDLAPVERMWNGLGLDPLPDNFDWPLVGQADYAALITTMCSIFLMSLNLFLCKVKPWNVLFLTEYGRQKGNETKGRSVGPKRCRLRPTRLGFT